MCFNQAKQGFTLIELLVVVLIIGILAAVALPQYQKAVEKSRAVQAFSLLKTVYQAAEHHYLETGEWPDSFDKLDVDVPWTGTTKYIEAWFPTKSNAEWSIQISTYGSRGVWLGRISGPYAGGGFAMYREAPASGVPTGQIVCVEGSSGNSVLNFSKATGDYCRKIFQGTEIPNGSASRYFTF